MVSDEGGGHDLVTPREAYLPSNTSDRSQTIDTSTLASIFSALPTEDRPVPTRRFSPRRSVPSRPSHRPQALHGLVRLVTGLSESELPVLSDARRRPPTASAHTRCSGQEHLQRTALNLQPLLTAKLLIQIGSHYPPPIAFNVHNVIPKLEQPPHPFGGASTQHYLRHRKRRQCV
jgi:hypothetical protein